MSALKNLNDRVLTLELVTEKELEQIKNDISSLKQDTKEDSSQIKGDIKDIKDSLLDIQKTLHRKEGAFFAIRTVIPYVLALVGVIMTLVILVGYEQRIEHEKYITYEVEQLKMEIRKVAPDEKNKNTTP
jgi:hypothetical protein